MTLAYTTLLGDPDAPRSEVSNTSGYFRISSLSFWQPGNEGSTRIYEIERWTANGAVSLFHFHMSPCGLIAMTEYRALPDAAVRDMAWLEHSMRWQVVAGGVKAARTKLEQDGQPAALSGIAR